MKSLKFLQKPEMLLLIVGLAAIVILIMLNLNKPKENKEGFYPITDARLILGDKASRRYNDFADTQDQEKVNVIPEMEEGDKMLNALLDTPSYEPDAAKVKVGPGQGIRYDDERKYRALPEPPELLRRIKLCEKVKGWQCEAISDPEFYKYCGICTKDGKDHLGYEHLGGMYIDPDRRAQSNKEYERTGKLPNHVPTFGVCKGEYILERPYCDVQKDRYECSVSQSLNDKNTASKCGFCVNGGGFVYIGNRGDKNENYVLKGSPVKHSVRLRLGVTHPDEAKIEVKRTSNGEILPGAFIKGTCVYLVDIPNMVENDRVTVKIKYAEYKDYAFTADDLKRMKERTNPPRAALARAVYGPDINDFTSDDPRAADVTRYVQDKFKMYDCSKTAVLASNDGLGGDPTNGISKQLRLAYSDDGVNFAYAYAKEGQPSRPVMTDTFKELCPVGIAQSDAEREVCEILPGGTTPTGRSYTDRPTNYYGTSGKAKCILETEKKPRGVLGMWESPQKSIRTIPIDLSVKTLNGLNVGSDGLPKYGTARNSSFFKQVAPTSKLPGVPEFLFWFWGKNVKDDSCEFIVQLPAFLRDPTILEDLRLCPGGPINTTPEGSALLQAGVCEKLINSKPQAPGTYTDDCLRSLFLAGGCTKEGKAYPLSQEKLNTFKKDPTSGDFLDADTMIANVRDYIFTPSSTGVDTNGNSVEADAYAQANMDCFGKIVSNVCDTAFKDTGPHTPGCLDYLFRNAGKDNPSIGATYQNVYNRSSGSDRLATTPILYCQRTGALAPIGADGKLNLTAIQTANEKGGVEKVRDFYRQIHYDANFNQDRGQQKENLEKCYGINVVDAAKPCPPPVAPPPFSCSSKLLPKNPKVFVNNKIGFIEGTTGNYKLSFDITPKSVNGGWGSILHFSSTGGNCCGLGERSPAIWTIPGTTRLHVRIGDAQDGNWGIDTDGVPLNKRTNVTLQCNEKDVTLTVGTRVYKVQQPSRRFAGNLHVWAGDPWHEAFNGTLDNLCYEIIPKLPPNTGSYEYKGNFVDSGRPLPMRVANVGSVEDCYKQAVQRNQNMFGLQYYGECWLGNNAPYDRAGPFKGDAGDLGVAYMNKVWVSPKNPPS